MLIDDHGGNCCGIKHLFYFPADYNGDRDAFLKSELEGICEYFDNYDDEDYSPDTWQGAVEVVLASYQLEEWRKVVEDYGFKEVFSFHNSNSGNRCHVFYLELNGEKK